MGRDTAAAIPQMSATEPVARLFAHSLKPRERGAVSAALAKSGVATDDVMETRHLFWRSRPTKRCRSAGGLERYGHDALLRSVVPDLVRASGNAARPARPRSW